MNLLLDTHVFLWWILDDPRLRPTSRELIGDASNVYWSAASSWEVSIKYALGRLPLPAPPERFLPAELKKNRILSLPVLDAHGFRAGALPLLHRDPFDRLLVAQAQLESLILLSDDASVRLYDVSVTS